MRIIGSPVSGRTSALVGGAGGAGAAGVTTGWGTDGDATTGSTPRANADDETAGTPGVRFAVLTDREGFLIETAGDLTPDTDEVAGALASCLAEASDGVGRELGQGQLVGTMLEYESGTLLLYALGPSALLAVLVADLGAVGKVRYYVRKAMPGLVRAL